MDRGLSNEDAYDLFCEQLELDPADPGTEKAWQDLEDWAAHRFFFPDDVVTLRVPAAEYARLLEELERPAQMLPRLAQLLRSTTQP